MVLFDAIDPSIETDLSGLEWLNTLNDGDLLMLFSETNKINLQHHIPRGQDIDGKYEIVFSGCSETHGDYLTDNPDAYDGKDIWGFLLAKYLGKSSINLGSGGMSAYEIVRNIFKFINEKNKPEQIFCLFPDLNRLNIPSDPTVLVDQRYQAHHGAYSTVAASLKATSHLPTFSKRPHIKEEVIPRVVPVILNLHSILALQKFCRLSNIELHYSTWSEQTDRILSGIQDLELRNGLEPSFRNYVSSDLKKWLTTDFNETCDEIHRVDLDLNHKYYDIGKDRFHIGAHRHAHVAEVFLDNLTNLD